MIIKVLFIYSGTVELNVKRKSGDVKPSIKDLRQIKEKGTVLFTTDSWITANSLHARTEFTVLIITYSLQQGIK